MSDIRIQDDLFEYVNHDWIESAVIPDDKPTAGGFADLAVDVEKKLMADFASMEATQEFPSEHLRNAVLLYSQIKDVKKRNRDGIRPALKEASVLLKIKDMNAFNRHLPELIYGGYPLPFAIGVDADMKDTKHHCVMLSGPSVILPDASYYKPGMEQQKESMLGLWSQMASAILAKTRLSPEDQALYLEDTLKFDAIIASLVKTSEEWADYPAIYNPMKTRTVAGLLKPIKFSKLLEKLFGRVPEIIVVAEPRFLKGFKELFNEENFPLYLHWAYVTCILGSTSLLSEELRNLGGTFRRALSGIAAMPIPEKFAYQLASNLFSQPVGLYYGQKYFGEEAKKDVTEMVYGIIAKYKQRLLHNDILSESTREKAILKLSKIEVKMGYPDKVEEIYDKMIVDPNKSAFENVSAISRLRVIDSLSKLDEPVDRTKWSMPGHLVNACYNPFSNDITFPAAILQAPFYSLKQTRSQNLGGIGAVIGHEISHAFDNNGARCDENGNLNNWWTKEDNKKFVQRTKAMIKEFDGIELPWGKVNGSFIVSENIADNGGMGVTLDMMHDIDGNFEEYFVNWAKVWCIKAKPEYQKLLLSVDVHAPAVLRANMQPQNFDEWYATYHVTKKDKMYLAPNKRVTIW